MLYSSMWANVPGMQAAVETYEAAATWGPAGRLAWTGGLIYSGALDPTNSPTTTLRPGLVLGQRVSDGQWTNYDEAATDGSEVAAGVLTTGIRMTDILSGAAQNRFYAILVGGPLQASKLIGLDLQARQQMSNFFQFDDNTLGNHWFPWKRFQTKTADYVVVAADNFTLFDNAGDNGAITFTLPALAPGYYFGFRGVANQNLTVSSAEGNNIVVLNDAAASSVSFQTGGELIGGVMAVYSDKTGGSWVVENRSTATITAA